MSALPAHIEDDDVVDGEPVEETGTALALRESLDLSDEGQVRELERRIEQMGADGDTIGLVDAEKNLGALQAALREIDVLSEQVRTAGVLRVKTWAELGAMDDLEAHVARHKALRMQNLATVRQRGKLPDLISWAQTNEKWGLSTLHNHALLWGCGYVRRGAMKGAIERSGLTNREIAERSGISPVKVAILRGSSAETPRYLRTHRVNLHDARKIAAVVGYAGTYPPAPPVVAPSRSVRRRQLRSLPIGLPIAPTSADWRTIQDACLKIRSALNALDSAGQNIDGLWLKCDDLFRAAQEGQKGLRQL